METTHSSSLGVKSNRKKFAIPFIVGVLAAVAMLGIYLGVLSAFQSFGHALQQAIQDWVWVSLVALGFGVQIGLYTFLRVTLNATHVVGATATTGAGTGTSTLGMIACCAHHLTDLAPLVALTGAGNLSGAISFLTDWKYVFIALGLGMNAIAIGMTWRTIRKSKIHLAAMAVGTAKNAPACH